jgi:DNA-binding IclR family transcriptional regulator
MEKTNETVHLVVRNQDHGIYIDKVECEQSIRMFSQIGKTIPLHCTAVGKVLLSSLSHEKIDEIYRSKKLESFTENTITDWEKLFRELKQIAEMGYSVDDEELTKDICCIAAPIKNFRGQVIAAISIAGPIYRIDKGNIDQLINEVKSCALKISKRIGYLATLDNEIKF